MPTPEYNLSKKGYHGNILIRRELLMFEKKKKWCGLLLHKLCQNTGFRRPLFSCIENKIFDPVLIRENAGQRKPVFWHILCIVLEYFIYFLYQYVSDWTTHKDYICASPLEVFFEQYFERNWHWQWSGSFL